MRYCLGIEYDGSSYHGWQSQPDGNTVQDEVEQALSRVADHRVSVVCAGRTDAGVHATSQIVHFDTEAQRSARSWQLGTNSELSKSINVAWGRGVSDDFHARFSALRRHYRYVILNRSYRSALLNNRVHIEPRNLDVIAMDAASKFLLGEHDFSALRAAGCQAKSPVRTITDLSVTRNGDFVIIDISANAFLQNMVRIIAGVLMRVGRQEAPADWVSEVVRSRDRNHLGVTARACGLYLTAVRYPAQFKLPFQPVPADKILPFL